jgi:hypothetical protein
MLERSRPRLRKYTPRELGARPAAAPATLALPRLQRSEAKMLVSAFQRKIERSRPDLRILYPEGVEATARRRRPTC